MPCFRKEGDKDGSERVGIRRAQLWEIRERWPRKLPDDTGHLAYLGLNRPFSSVAHTSGTNVQSWYRRGDLLSTRALRYLITHVKWLVESYRYRGLSLPDGGIEKKPQPRVLNIIARLEKGPRLYLFSSFLFSRIIHRWKEESRKKRLFSQNPEYFNVSTLYINFLIIYKCNFVSYNYYSNVIYELMKMKFLWFWIFKLLSSSFTTM